jgi:Inactive DUF488-N3 subclade
VAQEEINWRLIPHSLEVDSLQRYKLGIRFEGSMVKVKRIYDAAEPHDGYRVLVDRIWPRGISRENARIDLWMKEVARSDALRKWFGHTPSR